MPVHPRADNAADSWTDATQSARMGMDSRKQSSAAGIDDIAGALRQASERRREDGDDGLARVTASAADGLERVSSALRDKDVGTLLRDADAFARRQPAAFFGLAALAGFVAVRFIKAGHR